jgi:hypothetical protein
MKALVATSGRIVVTATTTAVLSGGVASAAPGYRVTVSVSVVKGSRTGSCSTSFTPHR